MADITDYFGKSSINSDYAVATTVESSRTAGVTVLEAVDLSKFTEDTPVFFITYKKVTDPLTDEVSVTDLVSWKGLVNGSANSITNLTLAPGYTDLGNDIGDFVELVPTSYWGNSLIDGLFVTLDPNGKLKANAPINSPQQSLANVTPVGSVLDFAGTSAPSGWLFCYGQTLNADTSPEYQALYDVIGNTYGGTNNSNFVIPDLRGRVVAGQDDMGGTSANRLTGLSGGVDGDVMGAAGGAQSHTLTIAQMPSHNHDIATYNSSGGGFIPVGSTASGLITRQTGNQGGGGAHNNVQPTLILNKIIKY